MGIVPGALLRIRQDLVRRLYFGELPGRIFFIIEVTVRMQLEGLLFVCLSNPT